MTPLAFGCSLTKRCSCSPSSNPGLIQGNQIARNQQGVTTAPGYRITMQTDQGVVRIVIARDGRLLAADVIQSSGIAVVDQGALNGIRAGSPYTPLPPEIGGNSAPFTLPLTSVPVGPRY